MGDNEEVRIQTTEAGEGAIPMKSDRPEWLPEKFESAEELAKSYGELEKKLGDNNAEAETPQEAKEQAEKATGVSLDKYYSEFADKKELSEESYTELDKQGLNKELVDSYIEGQNALAERQSAQVSPPLRATGKLLPFCTRFPGLAPFALPAIIIPLTSIIPP